MYVFVVQKPCESSIQHLQFNYLFSSCNQIHGMNLQGCSRNPKVNAQKSTACFGQSDVIATNFVTIVFLVSLFEILAL